MRRVTFALGLVLFVLGVFWAGRESTHGLSAFTDHWWCPLPLVAVLIGPACSALAARRRTT
ncbi:MAG TPA: hypothetical protein VL984_13595 [Acidimicrobiales bacterium]|nr:hypothetical protein [Acidimicrobiales bacterium]